MASLTITEALAELKTIDKRLTKKRESILPHLMRPDGLKDPLDKEGGSEEFIKRERQAIGDLCRRVVAIRTAIQTINLSTTITVSERTLTIAEWLAWRKEVAPNASKFVDQMRRQIQGTRQQATAKGYSILTPGAQAAAQTDIVVNVDEGLLAKEAEEFETILGTLDGQLSLKNATVFITIPD